MTDARTALEDLWTRAGCDPAALAQATLTGDDPALPSIFHWCVTVDGSGVHVPRYTWSVEPTVAEPAIVGVGATNTPAITAVVAGLTTVFVA